MLKISLITPSQVQTRALQICKSLFQKASVSQASVSFIHSVGPCVVRLVEGCMAGGVESGVVTEATQVLEVLLEATKDENSEFINCVITIDDIIRPLQSHR